MNLQLTGRRFDVSERLRIHVSKESKRLEKFYGPIIDCQVVVGSEKQMRFAEIIVNVQSHTLTATCQAKSVYRAVDGATDRIKVQLKKLHDKIRDRRGPSGAAAL